MTHREQVFKLLQGLSDEELSRLLSDGFRCSHMACPVFGRKRSPLSWCVENNSSCYGAWVDWLKEEGKGNEEEGNN